MSKKKKRREAARRIEELDTKWGSIKDVPSDGLFIQGSTKTSPGRVYGSKVTKLPRGKNLGSTSDLIYWTHQLGRSLRRP